MNKYWILLLTTVVAIGARAQRSIDFNKGWDIAASRVTEAKRNVTLPRAWNEEFAFCVPIEELPDDTVRYTKRFTAQQEWKDKKVLIEFEGARQMAEVWLNGKRVGKHENGVMAFGLDLTPYIYIGRENVLEVLTDNDWGYKETPPQPSPQGEGALKSPLANEAIQKDGNNLPNNELLPSTFQWNNKNFNANYGGLPKNVRLHVLPRLYQTLPLYSNLGTVGTYVYATDYDISGHAATIHVESEVKNETGKRQTVAMEVEVIDRQTGEQIVSMTSSPIVIKKGETAVLNAESRAEGLHFWSWGYGYLYDVKTRLIAAGKTTNKTISKSNSKAPSACGEGWGGVVGFRKTAFEHGQTILNDRTIMMHGYAQRTSNEWPGVGMSVPAWLSDYSNRLMVESGGNLVRWMHVCPWKQDIESCDRMGLIQAMPAGDAEKDVTGRHWEQRVELMRDAIIYNRNNPSILFYECGNKGISEEHMLEMKTLRDKYDPHGGRAIGSREMLSSKTAAEYGGEMLYINKSNTKPVWAMEYCRDEALRRYWDDWSYPYHKHGDGPLYRNADASAYNQNNDQFAIEMVRRWHDYWQERPGMGERVSNGGTKIIFSDTNTHNRGESNYRTSGVVDAMRLPKDAFYAHQVMWNGWVTPDSSQTHIIGHWNYNEGTVKPVYVVSDAPHVKLYLNGKEVGNEKVDYHFLHTFDSIAYEPGVLKAISYDANGEAISEHQMETAGEPVALRMRSLHPLGDRLNADGADMALLEVEAIDEAGRRCPLDNSTVHFDINGPIEWIGGIGKGEGNCIRSLDLPLECGVNRVLVRSTGQQGTATVAASVAASGETAGHGSAAASAPNGSAAGSAELSLLCGTYPIPTPSYLARGETPSTPSYTEIYKTLHPVYVKAGCNQETAHQSIDNSEDTEWKNDGRASTAWIRYEFENYARVKKIVMKLTGWRQRSYPLQIFADNLLIWEGNTPQSLGYVHIDIPKPMLGQSITIQLKGMAKSEEAFGQITELAAPVANELDLFKAKDGDKVRSELRIVECDFLTDDPILPRSR